MQMHSLSSTEASTPILDSGSRIRLDPCSGGGEILHCENYSETHHDCDSGRLIHAPLISQSACLKVRDEPYHIDSKSKTTTFQIDVDLPTNSPSTSQYDICPESSLCQTARTQL